MSINRKDAKISIKNKKISINRLKSVKLKTIENRKLFLVLDFANAQV